MKDNKLAKDLDFLMNLPVSSASKNPASPVENTAGAFTPGPWRMGKTSAEYFEILAGDFAIGDTCASMYDGTNPVDQPNVDLGEANARLIAAAPDLYEALIAALPYIECELDNTAYKRGAVAKVVTAMNAAIAKAEGRS